MRSKAALLIATAGTAFFEAAPVAQADIISADQAACSSLRAGDGCVTPDGNPGRCQYPPGFSQGSRDARGRPIPVQCRGVAAESEPVRNADAAPSIESPPARPATDEPQRQPSAHTTPAPSPVARSRCSAGDIGLSGGGSMVCALLVACAMASARQRTRHHRVERAYAVFARVVSRWAKST
ncbi:MAG: hypothetical protein JNK05_16770 [Myxococcales bacterium]|nr:hypothetical protein [Myxococcales bacterium]